MFLLKRGAGVTLSVVVATRDRPQLLDDCLLSLRNALSADDELIVVDSASISASTAAVATARGARLVRCSKPGTSLARNTGWRAARGVWVAFVDDDVRVDAQWARALRVAAAERPQTAFLTGRLRLHRPTERPVAVFDAERAVSIDRYTVADVGHGANFAVRRDALEAVGGFDESLGPGARWHAGEDLELIDRLVVAGFEGRYEPAVCGYHEQWRTLRDLYSLEWSYGLGQGARLALLWRLDRNRCWAAAKKTTFESGVVELCQSILRRWKRNALRALIRLAGTAVGFAGMTISRMGLPRSSSSELRRSA